MKPSSALLVALPFAGLSLVGADSVTATNVKAALTAAKVTFQESKDEAGDPMFELKYDEFGARIVTYMVNDSKSEIARLSWNTAVDLKEGMTDEAVNAWNSDHLDIKVYLDAEKDPILEANHTVAGGVTEANIQSWLQDVKAEAEEFFADIGPVEGSKEPARLKTR